MSVDGAQAPRHARRNVPRLDALRMGRAAALPGRRGQDRSSSAASPTSPQPQGWTCIAYCLMTSHYHLIVEVGGRRPPGGDAGPEPPVRPATSTGGTASADTSSSAATALRRIVDDDDLLGRICVCREQPGRGRASVDRRPSGLEQLCGHGRTRPARLVRRPGACPSLLRLARRRSGGGSTPARREVVTVPFGYLVPAFGSALLEPELVERAVQLGGILIDAEGARG